MPPKESPRITHPPADGAESVDRAAAVLTERRGAIAICSLRVEGVYPVRADVLSAGDRHPLGIGAGSIAILAALPDTEIAEILSAKETSYLDRYQPVTPALWRELVAEERRGYALHRGLVHPGAWGMGVAIRDPKGIRSRRCRSEPWSTGSASSGSATCSPRCAKSRSASKPNSPSRRNRAPQKGANRSTPFAFTSLLAAT